MAGKKKVILAVHSSALSGQTDPSFKAYLESYQDRKTQRWSRVAENEYVYRTRGEVQLDYRKWPSVGSDTNLRYDILVDDFRADEICAALKRLLNR